MDEPLHFDDYIQTRLANLDMTRPSRTLERVRLVVDESSECLVIGTPLRGPCRIDADHGVNADAGFP